MLQRVRTIIDKEWAEVFKNRMVLYTVILMPVLMTLLPLVMTGVMSSTTASSGDATDIPAQYLAMCGDISGGDCMMIFMLSTFMIMFMMIPMAIPIAIAAYSIVGEKTTHSLEPLLAAPITTEELLLGKALAAVIPGVLATWVGYGIFILAAPWVGATPPVAAYIVSPTWLVGILLIGPLMAVLSVNFAIIVSSRVTDPRAAEQISMVIIVPLLGLLFGQIGGLFVINTTLMWGVCLVLAVLDVAVVFLGARLFQREVILTRWK